MAGSPEGNNKYKHLGPDSDNGELFSFRNSNWVDCQVKAVKVKMEAWKNGQDKSVRLVGPVMRQNGEDWGGPERLHGALPLPIISSLPPTRALNVSGSTRRLAESCRLVWPALARTCILYVSLLPSHTISWVTLIHPFPGDRIVWAFSSNRDSGLLGGYRGQKRKEPTQEREIHNNAKFVYILPLGSSFIQIFSRFGWFHFKIRQLPFKNTQML